MEFSKRHEMGAGMLAAALAALALSITLCGSAWADDPSTDCYIKADDSQISWSVPISVHFSVNPDGTFRAAENGTFLNNSVFPIHIKTAKVTVNEDANLIAKGTTGAPADSIWTVLSASGGQSIGTSSMDLYYFIDAESGSFTSMGWVMAGKQDSPDNAISIAYEGAITEFDEIEPASDLKYANISWVAAAGQGA